MATVRVDLNADLGEATDRQGLDDEALLLSLISSANVACGFHAGGSVTMRETVHQAAARSCAVGAHPSYPDRSGFGRRFVDATPAEIYADTLYQIGALGAFCRAEGIVLSHVKAHGALYNRAAIDPVTAAAIAEAVFAYDPALPLFGLPASPLIAAAQQLGLPAVQEAFADRAYNADGTLVSRRLPGAMIHNAQEAARRALRMVTEGRITAIDGTEIEAHVDTICLHGDEPGAVERARAIRAVLDQAGVQIMAPEASRQRS